MSQHSSKFAPRRYNFDSKAAWMTALREFYDPLILKMLEDNEGAVLWWQVELEGNKGFLGVEFAMQDALERGVILFDSESDLYIHPAAVRLDVGSYTMKEQQ